MTKEPKPEWFTDCVHCLGKIDDEQYLIIPHPQPPQRAELVACAHIACEEMAHRQITGPGQLLVSLALFKPCPPELADLLSKAPSKPKRAP